MVAKSKRAKYVLPSVVNPPTSTGYCVPVPDDIQHLGAFLGQLKELASANSWQDDTLHTAKDVALVWRDIFDGVLNSSCQSPFMEQGCQAGTFLENPYQFQSYNPPLSTPNEWVFGVGWKSTVDGTGRSRLSVYLPTITDVFTSYSFQVEGTLGDAYTARVYAKLAGFVTYDYTVSGNLPATLTADPSHVPFTADTLFIDVQLTAVGNTNQMTLSDWEVCYIGKPPILTSGNIWEITLDIAANGPGAYNWTYGHQGSAFPVWTPGVGYGGRCIYEMDLHLTLSGDATTYTDWVRIEGEVDNNLVGYAWAYANPPDQQRYYSFSGYIFPTFIHPDGPFSPPKALGAQIGYYGSDCAGDYQPYGVWMSKVVIHGSGTPPTIT